jgi:RNA polymerase primary sigma factor
MAAKDKRTTPIQISSKTAPVASLTRKETARRGVSKAKSPPEDFQELDSVNAYLREIGRIPLLNAEEEIYLFSIIRDAAVGSLSVPDQEQVFQAKERVVVGNLRLVAKIAMKYRNLGLPFLDLVQEGNVGLMKAVEGFDLEKGFRFTTYATWWIQQSMMRALTDHGRTIRLPAHIVERLGKLNRSREHLQQRYSKQPTMEEVAEAVALPIEKVRQTFELSQELASLDLPLDNEEERNSFIDLIQNPSIPSPEDEVSAKAVRERLNEVLKTLLPREEEVLRMRFGLTDGTAYTLEQLGQIFGITRERVRQIEKKALMKLRHPKRSIKLKEFVE